MKCAVLPVVAGCVLAFASSALAADEALSPPKRDLLPAPETPSASQPPQTGLGVAKDGYPLAGWHNGLFYLRDYNDNFRLHLQGRAQIDFYSFLGPGVSSTTLEPTLFLRRVRPELTGEFFHDWSFMFGGDFGATALDNPNGTNETAAAPPGVAPAAGNGRFASAQTPRLSAQVTDVFVNWRKAKGAVNVQLGQFDAPFTMENRTSDKFIPFMERSLAVRAIGIPTNKEVGVMGWGELPTKHFAYAVGVFNGDGQNRLNVDGRFDVMGRLFVHPFADRTDALKNLQIGGSVRYGSRDKKTVNYDYAPMTTQANYTFWNPIYGGSKGTTHILPSGDQIGAAGELRIPVSIVDLTSEVVYVHNGTREALEGYQASNTERFGVMSGLAYYVQFGIWLFGDRDVNGLPGYENPSHVDFSKADPESPPRALQLLAKWEQVKLSYESASRAGVVDPRNIDGDINVNALSFGANYWFTKHLRLSANYVFDMFPSSAPVRPTAPGGPSQTSDQRAIAPGNTLPVGVDNTARDTAHSLHEILFRAAIAL